MPVNNLAEK